MKTFFVILLIVILWFLSGFIAFYLDAKYISKITETTPMYEVKDGFACCMIFGIISLFIAVMLIIARFLKTPIEKFLKKFISRINKKEVVILKVKDLIKKKDYDYIEWRMTLPEGDDIFIGATASKNGKLISLDSDIYSDQIEVLRYKEWSQPKDNIQNGLTVIVEGRWS